MHASVHVRSGDPATGETALTTYCLIVFVALGADGQAVTLPGWVPQMQEDVALDAHARHLIDLRSRVDT